MNVDLSKPLDVIFLAYAECLNVEFWQKALLIEALGRTNGDRTKAAKLLGISIRSIRNWIHRFDLPRKPDPRKGLHARSLS